MKIGSFDFNGSQGVGRVDETENVIFPFLDAEGSWVTPANLNGLIPSLDSSSHILKALKEDSPVALADIRWLPPILPPKNVFCVGKNYSDHAVEFEASGFDGSTSTPNESGIEPPIIFTKPYTSLAATDQDIIVNRGLTQKVDYEAEFVLVIGKPGKDIPESDALSHVWGVTLGNDVTARDLQREHKQWFLGKASDTFLPLGPWVVTLDDIDLDDLEIECRVNGELRQKDSIESLIHGIPKLISTISSIVTLEAGDLIATGTPAGVGIGYDPPKFLQDQDVVEVYSSQIGTLRNVVTKLSSTAG